MNDVDKSIMKTNHGNYELYTRHEGCEVEYLHIHKERPLPADPVEPWYRDDSLFWKVASLVCIVTLLVIFLHR